MQPYQQPLQQRQYAQQPNQQYAQQQYPPQQTYQQPQAATAPQPQSVPEVLDHKMIIPLIVIIFLVLTGGIGYYLFTRESSSEGLFVPAEFTDDNLEDNFETEITKEEVQTYTSEDYVELLLYDADSCESNINLIGPNSRDSCYYNLATRTLIADYCVRMIVTEGPVSSDSCFINIALEHNDMAICSNINTVSGDESMDECYFEIAKLTSDVRLCDYMVAKESPNSRADCFSYFSTTESAYAAEYLN